MQQCVLHMQSCCAASQVLVYDDVHSNANCLAKGIICMLPALGGNVVDK